MSSTAAERKQFEEELALLSDQLRIEIDVNCQSFDTDPAARAARVNRVQDDYQFFVQTYFPHYVTSSASMFHKWLFSDLPKAIDKKSGQNIAVAAPRGEAKSTLVTQLFLLWCVITNRKRFPVIIMDAVDQAAMMLEAIKVELTSNPRLQMDFPKAAGQGRVWRQTVILTANNTKIQIAGTAKKVRGWRHGAQRPDLVILDDIENDENVAKKEQRDKIQRWLKKAVMKLGPPDGSMDIIYLGTVLHYDSVLNRTLKSPTWKSRVFKAIVRWPNRRDIWDQWEEILINEGEELAEAFYLQNSRKMEAGAVVSWPEVRPLKMLMLMRAEDHHAFDSEMQNDPTNSENAPFKDLQYWVHESSNWIYYGACDPSLGKKNKGRDPSAILVGGFNRDTGVMDVVEAKIAKRLPSLIITQIIELQRQYSCILWAFESVQFQEFMRTELIKKGIAAGVPVPARAVIPSVDKNLRIESLEPYVTAGHIRTHQSQTVMNEHMIHYPEVAHDDGPDCLHMLWMLASSSAGGIPDIRSGNMKGKY